MEPSRDIGRGRPRSARDGDTWRPGTWRHCRTGTTRAGVYGCDLLSDGSIRGSSRLGYDGWDHLSFDPKSGKFVPANSSAETNGKHWEQEGIEVERWTNYLKHLCPESLRKYVGYRQKELEHKEPPDVHMSGREEHGTLILSCHAYGFYPNTITVSWMKGSDTLDQETERGGIVPNSDGTFHTWARIEALPEEREQYRCRVEHPGMPEPRIFAWEPTSGGNLTVVVAVSVIAAILILIGFGFSVWKLQSGRRDRSGYNPAAGRDMGTNSSSTVFLRQETQILTMLHFWCEIILLWAINPGSLHQCLEVLLWEPGMGMGSLGQRWRHREQGWGHHEQDGRIRSWIETPGAGWGLVSHTQLHPLQFISCSMPHVQGAPRAVWLPWVLGGTVGWWGGHARPCCPQWSLSVPKSGLGISERCSCGLRGREFFGILCVVLH
ncbi:class I histocompatibility antigen, F10 alpha chain-like [Serinus canaria]|uniref:class I histocompatibility antigen, F10 alpha chain-like n=1 Tax=Serinus canaria TaxID=9135 RepID=UPI0021CD09C6|nr:class I histocompatibility antigen, F10 alpha chain-like [Serinus canaria]